LSNHYGITRFEETGPLYPIHFAIMKDIVTLYIDTTGENLYKRGYREKSVLAPMRETLAYSMIDLSFWRGDRMFIDPFCGSGTIPIEAALYATNTAPGIKRRFVAETWRNHISKDIWKSIRDEARENANPDVKTQIYASDIDPEAIAIAKKNAENAGVADKINFSVCDMAKISSVGEKGVIICNPPYGERLLDAKQCERLYRIMGRKFAEFPNMKKLILTSNEQFEQSYGSFADKRRKVYNGMLKCYIYQYFR
jgi:putative N6-adenine-specific DNA methylase